MPVPNIPRLLWMTVLYDLQSVLCRILNKLTPEKFDKLSLELLNVGIDSHTILKGIILLVCIVVCASIFRMVVFSNQRLK
jgi:hypothetical protein